MVKIRHCRNYW